MLGSTLRRGAALIAAAASFALAAAPAGAATTFTPNRFDDPLIGGTSCGPPAVANGCSLRGAIAAAQAGDTVQLASGTYTLSFGELKLERKITITGAGQRSPFARPSRVR